MTRAIVHIGDGKCGSTSIQAGLFLARHDLAALGILYHPITRTSGHFAYCTLTGGATRDDDARQQEIASRNLEENRKLIRKGDYEFVVISAESLFRSPPEMVKDIVGELGCDTRGISVIVYIREPSSMYLSLMQQRLKASHSIASPARYRRDFIGPLVAWNGEPRATDVRVRPFDRRMMRGGSAVVDFQDVLRLITSLQVNLPDSVENMSLFAEQTIVLQALRRSFPAEWNNRHRPESDRMIRFFQDSSLPWQNRLSRPRLSTRVRREIAINNSNQVKQVGLMFPELDLSPWCVDALPNDEFEAWTNPGFNDILDAYSAEAVHHLSALVSPDASVNDEIVEDALEFFSFSSSHREAYEKFRKQI